MILPMKDLRQALKGYDFVKTVCGSEYKDQITFTVNDGECQIVAPDIELSCAADIEGYDNPINLDTVTMNIIKKIKVDGSVTITTDSITIGSKTVNHVGEINPPKLNDTTGYECLGRFNAVEVQDAIKGTKHAIAKEDSRPALTYLSWKNNEIVGVDGFRIAQRGVTNRIEEQILLSPVVWKFLEKFIDKKLQELVQVWRKDGQLQIIYGDWVLFTKYPLGWEFLKYENVFTDEADLIFKVNRKALVEKLEFMMPKERQPIKFSLINDLELNVKTPENLVTDTLEIEWMIKRPLEIAFNPKFVLEALKTSKDEIVCVSMISSLTPMIITFSTGKELILPVRLP